MGHAQLARDVARANSLLRQVDDSLADDVWERTTVDKDAAQLIDAPVTFGMSVVGVRADVMRNTTPETVVLGRGHAEGTRRRASSYVISIHQQGIHLSHHPGASYIERHDCFFKSDTSAKKGENQKMVFSFFSPSNAECGKAER